MQEGLHALIFRSFAIRDVPEAEYLIQKGTDNGFRTNNEFTKQKK